MSFGISNYSEPENLSGALRIFNDRHQPIRKILEALLTQHDIKAAVGKWKLDGTS